MNSGVWNVPVYVFLQFSTISYVFYVPRFNPALHCLPSKHQDSLGNSALAGHQSPFVNKEFIINLPYTHITGSTVNIVSSVLCTYLVVYLLINALKVLKTAVRHSY